MERLPIPEETDVHMQVKDVWREQRGIKVEQDPVPEETQVQIQVEDVQCSHVKVEDAVSGDTEIYTKITEEQVGQT